MKRFLLTMSILLLGCGGTKNFLPNVKEQDKPGSEVLAKKEMESKRISKLSITVPNKVREGAKGFIVIQIDPAPLKESKVKLQSSSTNLKLRESNFSFLPNGDLSRKLEFVTEKEDGDEDSEIVEIIATSEEQDVKAKVLLLDKDTKIQFSEFRDKCEEGATCSFSVKLSGNPGESREVRLSSTHPDLILEPYVLQFSEKNWSIFQKVTLSANDNDSSSSYSASVFAEGENLKSLQQTVLIVDNDVPLYLSESAPLLKGMKTSFKLKIGANPIFKRKIFLSSSNKELSFTPDTIEVEERNWKEEKEIIVELKKGAKSHSKQIEIKASGQGFRTFQTHINAIGEDILTFPGLVNPEISEGNQISLPAQLQISPMQVMEVEVLSSKPEKLQVLNSKMVFLPSSSNPVQYIKLKALEDLDDADENVAISFFLKGNPITKIDFKVKDSHPIIQYFSPRDDMSSKTVKIYGMNFHPELNKNRVFFEEREAKILSGNTNQIEVEIPSEGKSNFIRMENPYGTAKSIEKFEFSPLALQSTYPENNSRSIPLNSNISLTFNRELKESSLSPNTIQVSAKGKIILGSYKLVNPKTVEFIPDSKWKADTEIHVSVKKKLESKNGSFLDSETKFSFTTEAPVEFTGVNPPAVYKNGKTKGMRIAAQDGNEGKRYAILIGINKYQDAAISPLDKARNDAKAISEIFRKYGQFDAVYTMTDDIDPRSDTEKQYFPSLQNTKAKIEGLIKEMDPNDLFIFFFSGHGISDYDENGYLIVNDTTQEEKFKTSLSVPWIVELLQKQRIRKSLLILDACREKLYGSKNLGRIDLKEKDYQEAELSGVFFSTRAGYFSYEDEESDYGVFTKFLIYGMEGKADKNKDGVITFSELETYVQSSVKKWSVDKNKAQKPYTKIHGEKTGDLAITHSPEPPPPGESLADQKVKEPNRIPYILRSALIPGWGQYKSGETKRAKIYAGVGLGLAGLFYYSLTEVKKAQSNYNSSYTLLGSFAIPSYLKQQEAKKDLNKADRLANISFSAFMGFWLWNIFDAAFVTSIPKEESTTSWHFDYNPYQPIASFAGRGIIESKTDFWYEWRF